MKKIILLTFILFIATQSVAEIITPAEMQIFNTMMLRNNIKPGSENFLKDWVSSTEFKIPVIIDILNNPMEFPNFVERTEQILSQQSFSQIISYFGQEIFASDSITSCKKEFKNYFQNKVKNQEDIFGYIDLVFAKSDFYYQQVWDSLSIEELKILRYSSYTMWAESEDSLKYQDFFTQNDIDKFDDLEFEESVIPIIKKINFSQMMNAVKIFQDGFDVLKNSFSENKFVWGNRIESRTKWGNFCIGSAERDIYSDNYTFILDPNGDDIYNSKINTTFFSPYYMVLDFKGNDLYQNQTIGGLFSVVQGIGINFDADGDDFYHGNDLALSCLFGYQLSIDEQGDDVYRTGLYSLGAGTFGISNLTDKKGNDIYSVTECGEAFGGTLGAGLLLDFSGNDFYFAGGKYYHTPLAPFDTRSMSQGFGFGVRPIMAGGIGFLYDEDGNDSFKGGVYAQAVAYWYALGIIVDKSGNDFYDAVYYPQGSGIHLAGGFLYDEKGEDHYYSKHGPGQGSGHDYSVGFLVDRGGNDRYSIEGGNGLGLTNSVGIFLDVAGDDKYQNKYDANYGYGRQARNSGSIGLFLDTGGNDSYPLEMTKNDTFWINGNFGMGLDTLFFVPEQEPIEEKAEANAAEIDTLASIEEIFDIASEWEVGSSIKRVQKAREILLEKPEETAEFIFNERLDTKSGLVFRAIKYFIKNSVVYKPYIPKGLELEDSLCVKNTMSIIGELQDTSYVDTLETFVIEKKYLKSALSTLGDLKTKKSVDILKEFMNDPSEKIRVITARAFLKIDSPYSNKNLRKMKNDDSFLIRSMVRLKFGN
ncbi:MAG: hypothetical protein U9P79_07995 [Candidatus Cloacimonadota bacterium]|nr:hypothetical protein [Candidatus Cloacimonadota bacterium]